MTSSSGYIRGTLKAHLEDLLKRMKNTILCKNTKGRLIGLGEHGFSAFIETERGKSPLRYRKWPFYHSQFFNLT
jgi:hypothetical protein